MLSKICYTRAVVHNEPKLTIYDMFLLFTNALILKKHHIVFCVELKRTTLFQPQKEIRRDLARCPQKSAFKAYGSILNDVHFISTPDERCIAYEQSTKNKKICQLLNTSAL